MWVVPALLVLSSTPECDPPPGPLERLGLVWALNKILGLVWGPPPACPGPRRQLGMNH